MNLPHGSFNLPPGCTLKDIDPPNTLIECPNCLGEEEVETSQQLGDETKLVWITCSQCRGTGQIDKET